MEDFESLLWSSLSGFVNKQSSIRVTEETKVNFPLIDLSDVRIHIYLVSSVSDQKADVAPLAVLTAVDTLRGSTAAHEEGNKSDRK